MAITLVGSTITIDSGVAAGTATGGTSTTLTGTGFSTAWADRIIYLTGGTGAGQSRPIRSATTTAITVTDAWDVTPDATTTFAISYDVRDIVTALPASASHVGLSRQKIIQTAAFINVIGGGVFGGLDNFIIFTGTNTYMHSAVGGFIQFGRRVSSEKGVSGGGLFYNQNGTTYTFYNMAGVGRFYQTRFSVTPESATGQALHWLFQSGGPQSAEFIDCLFENFTLQEGTNRTLVNNRFIGSFAGMFTPENPVRNAGSEVFSAALSVRTDLGNPNGSDSFDLQYFLPNPSTGLFTRPIFCFNYSLPDGVHYYWNTSFPAGLASSIRWFNNLGNGLFYEGYSVAPDILDLDGDPVADVTLALIDKDGNAGWTVSKDASFNPVKQTILKTNASGTVTNSAIGSGENAFVTRSRWSRQSEFVSQAINYYPFTLKIRKYGYVYLSETADFTERTLLTKFLAVDDNITQTNGATVAAYTTLENTAKFYDRCRYFESLDANIAVNLPITRSGDLIDAGSYNVVIDATAAQAFALSGNTITIKASIYTGDMTTTGVITLANGAEFIGTRTDANGTIAPPKTVSITGIVAGSRLQIYNVTTDTEIVNQIVAGTSYAATYNEGTGYTEGDVVRVRLAYNSGATAKLPFTGQAIVGSTGWALLASQQDDAVYNSLGIDGSAVTEFVADFPNIQVDINDPDGSTRVDRLYAWFVDAQTTADGVRNWFGGIVPEDEANFRVVTDTLDLKIDNVSANGVTFTDGRRLYRDDNTSPLVGSTTGGGSITFFAGKVYTSVVSTASPVITGDIADVPAAVQSGMTAQGYTTERATEISAIKAKADTLVNGPTLAEIEGSALAKEATIDALAIATQTEHDATQAAIAALPEAPTTAAVADAVRAEVKPDLEVINAGVKLASLGIPHSEDLEA